VHSPGMGRPVSRDQIARGDYKHAAACVVGNRTMYRCCAGYETAAVNIQDDASA
jgi:hypothetical protein